MKKLGIAVLIVVIVLVGGILWYRGRGVEVKSEIELSEQEGKYADYANPDVIVSAVRAKEIMEKEEDVLVIDIRKSVAYSLGHIPGAVNAWRPDYSADDGEYPFEGMRCSKEKMEVLLGNLGADENTFILLYDDRGNYDAARFWWQLDMYGHDKVALIDGGLDGWKAAGFEVTTSKPEITPKEFRFKGETDLQKLATLEDVKEAISDPDVIILDVRAFEEFTGEKLLSGAYRKGRIPGSIWIEYKEALNEDNTFKTADELREIYESKGVTPDKNIIVYCQSGVRSAHTTFVLTQLLEYENVRNYDGSWIEWSYYEELPIETGEAK